MLMIEPIHAKLADKELLPTTHLVDSGYVGTSQLIESQQKYEVELFGPIRQNSHWQARAGQGYAMADFKIDWEAEKVICPEGHTSHLWNEAVGEGGKPIIRIDFHQRNCQPCPKRALCTKAKNAPRELTLRPKEQHLVMEQRRAEQQTEEWKKRYQQRAGIEGTLSQGVRGFGLRNCRYIGLAKTRLQHLAIAAAINLERAINWLAGLEPAKTRVSRFAALALFP